LQTGENVCISLVYNQTEKIEDTYKFTIIDSNSASVETDSDHYSGFIGKQMQIPFKINSGNSTFRFNVHLEINGTTYSYLNAPGN